MEASETTEEQTNAEAPVRTFFPANQHLTSEVNAIVRNIKRREAMKPFVSRFVTYAGYPDWEKSLILSPPSGTWESIVGRGADGHYRQTVIVPFSFENDTTLNAIMKVSLSPTDTSFQMLYRWQYNRHGYEKTDARNNADQTALFFMGYESYLFNHRQFRIKDSLLLRGKRSSDIITITSFNITGNTAAVLVQNSVEICFSTDCPEEPPKYYARQGLRTAVVPGVCLDCTTYKYWYENGQPSGGGGESPSGGGDGWGEPPTAGSGGGGGNDSGGGDWTDIPCNPLSSLRVQSFGGNCDSPPAWEPADDIPLVKERDVNGYLYSRISELQTILQEFPQALLPCDSLNIMPLERYGSMWQNVAQFKPSQNVLNRVDSIKNVAPQWWLKVDNFAIQSLEDAKGAIVNCDFFPVRITKMPTGYTPESLLEYFRRHINNFIDPGLNCSFGPYIDGPFNDVQKYIAPYEESVGTLWSLKLGGWNKPGIDGSVIESGYSRYNSGGYQTHNFTFSTMTTPLDFNHPVSGNRRFGIYSDPDHPGEFVFYTMGVDRTSDWFFDVGNNMTKGFESADSLWTSLQNGMAKFINDNTGTASFYSKAQIIARPKWDEVKEYLKGNIDFLELKRRLGC